MKFLRKNRLTIQIFATCLLAIWLPRWFLSGPAWTAYSNGQGLGPGSIGAPAQEDTPVAHSIAEMEALDRFMVERVMTDWDDHEGGVYLDGVYYEQFTLQSGEKILIRCSLDGYTCDPENDYWGSPIGVWRAWDLSEQNKAILAREAPGLTVTDHYADMMGDHWDPMDQEEFVGTYIVRASFLCLAALVVLQFLFGWLRRRLAGKKVEVTRVRSDLELWLVGTYAIWAQFFAEYVMQERDAAAKGPFRIGALPRTPETVRAMKETLADSWDIGSYQDLLETVEYMSEGPGYRGCGGDQAGLAWELCRSMQLLGCAYMAGWCSREECIRRSCAVGRTMQKDFRSWEELCQGFLEGYSAWRLSEGQDAAGLAAVQQRADIYWAIRRREDSPYHLPWNMDLDPDQPGRAGKRLGKH